MMTYLASTAPLLLQEGQVSVLNIYGTVPICPNGNKVSCSAASITIQHESDSNGAWQYAYW